MAEEEEVIILEEDETPSAETPEEEPTSSAKKPDKKLWLILGLTLLLLIVAVTVLVLLLTRKPAEKTAQINPSKLAREIKSAQKSPTPTPSQIEQMIKKANLLYQRGNKKEALDLFEQIATFSAAVSYYNLGVAQMMQENYQAALESFKKAIRKGENRAVSALNAAVCALHLKKLALFHYYLDMAEASLPDIYGSPLYGYLYALIHYYKGNYFETLSAVYHADAHYYRKEIDRLGAVAYTVFLRPQKAIGLLERKATPTDYLILGQLYARTGDYNMAERYLQMAIEKSDVPIKSRKSLALVELKNFKPQKSADLLKKLQTDFKNRGKDLYPIQTRLAKAVYDIEAAQRRYNAESLVTPPDAFKLLFEFAPFKVFNAMQTIRYIQKGNAAIYVDQTPDATHYLSRGSTLSNVDLLISKAIKAAIDHRLRQANAILQKALKIYPNHAILHYDLALTYARLGDYEKANRHFLRSYHLDTSDYEAATFALMCETIRGKPIPQVEKFVHDDLAQITEPNVRQQFERALFFFYQGNYAGASKWLQTRHKKRPLYLTLDLLIAANMGMWDRAKEYADTLRGRLPRNVLANILYLQITQRGEPIKKFSGAAQRYLKTHPLDLDEVYYGGTFTRENYIALRFITGTLYPFKLQTQKRLIDSPKDPVGIIETLALSDIYLKAYEEAYVLLNKLVDHYDMQDSRTLFLTAVAAIGAGHHANAAALLELAKLTDPNNLESRYALGLLYLEQGNVDAAVIQFSKIPDGTFRSKFFDFDIVGYRKRRD